MMPTKEVAYAALVGIILLAALLEWILWLAAFLYCLCKVYRKAEHWSIKALAVAVGTIFIVVRGAFFPVMIVALPLPGDIVNRWPRFMVECFRWLAFWAFAGLLTIPWLFCTYQLVTHHFGRSKRVKQAFDDNPVPNVVVIVPCYKEKPDVLIEAVDSVVNCEYPAACIHVFLSFDDEEEDELYHSLLDVLRVPSVYGSYPGCIDTTYKGVRVTVSRFPHGGKRHCQGATFGLIERMYGRHTDSDDLFVLFVDSDCVLDRGCLRNFIYDMELSPGNKRDILAMTGVIMSTTEKSSLITLLQDMEYIHGQFLERTVESACGAVTCLPGALTMLRYSAFRKMAKYYFSDKWQQSEDLFDFAKCHLGEDRWLTHLFMIGARRRHQVQLCTSALCKTEAVQTYRALVKQRRRWFLGFITNEVCMLTDWRLWKMYPLLVLVRFMQNTIRTTPLLFSIMVLGAVTTSTEVADLPMGFLAVSMGLNWLMMIYLGARLRRYKMWLYPVMFVLNPLLNWVYTVYGIFTANQRTWGGPRAGAVAPEVAEGRAQ